MSTAQLEEWRLELRVKKRALRDYMTYKRETVRSLAKKVECARSTIGHMRSPSKERGVLCPPELAARIEEELDAPPGSIFEPKVSRVSQDVVTQRRAA